MRNRYLPLLFAMLGACSPSSTDESNMTNSELLYVGTYSVRGSKGVYVYQFDRSNKTFKPVEQISGPDSPSFLTISGDKKHLYTTNRKDLAPDSPFGFVSAYDIDPQTGKLSLINQSSSFGVSPCHIHVDEQKQSLYLSHYAGGSLSVLSLLPDGSIGNLVDSISHVGSSVHPNQKVPHVHTIHSIPKTNYFITADLGTDKLYFYQNENGVALAPIEPIAVKAGAGPRHFELQQDAKYLYLAEELSSTVSVYSLDISNKTHKFLQRLPTLPTGFSDRNSVADIHASADGKFLYVSNRGHDSLAIYSIDPSSGLLTFVAHQKSGGKTPRNFLIDPQGKFVLIAHQNSDDVIYFKRDQTTGLLEMTDIKLEIPSPVCLEWLEL